MNPEYFHWTNVTLYYDIVRKTDVPRKARCCFRDVPINYSRKQWKDISPETWQFFDAPCLMPMAPAKGAVTRRIFNEKSPLSKLSYNPFCKGKV